MDHCSFKASLAYRVKPCLKKETEKIKRGGGKKGKKKRKKEMRNPIEIVAAK